MPDHTFSTASTAARLRNEEILLAVQHHQRALTSLQGATFEHFSATTRQKLVHILTKDLRLLERELKRRGLDTSDAEVMME